jgi:peptidoglycan/LPS O-acetylase OafA/YrhL
LPDPKFFLLGIQILRSKLGFTSGWDVGKMRVPGEFSLFHSSIAIIIMTLTFSLWISSKLWNTIIPGGWSIQAEVGHYLFFPLLKKASTKQALLSLSFVNVFSSSIFVLVSRQSRPTAILSKLALAWCRLDLFVTISYFYIGMLAFRIFTSYLSLGNFEILRKNRISLIIFFASFVALPLNFGNQPEALLFLIFSILVAITIKNRSLLGLLFKKLGTYSYFIYFCHFQVLWVVESYLSHINRTISFKYDQLIIFLLVFLISIIFSAILAIPSFKFFEGPILKLARRVP